MAVKDVSTVTVSEVFMASVARALCCVSDGARWLTTALPDTIQNSIFSLAR